MSKILAKIEIEERADIPIAREHKTTARVGWSQVTSLVDTIRLAGMRKPKMNG